MSRRLSSVPSWKLHPALGKSPWRCAWGTRDGVSLPAQSATEHAGQNEGLILGAGENRPPDEGHSLQKRNETVARERSVGAGPCGDGVASLRGTTKSGEGPLRKAASRSLRVWFRKRVNVFADPDSRGPQGDVSSLGDDRALCFGLEDEPNGQ